MSLEKIDFGKIVAAAAASNPPKDGDYMKDGLLYCGKCNTPKQCRVNLCGTEQVMSCMCACREMAYNAEKEAEDKRQHELYINSLRTSGLMDGSLRSVSFDKDDGRSKEYTDKGRRYVANWGIVERDNMGLLLWGNTGNGKTFTAACIANALIEQGVSVMMTSFPRILSALQGMYSDDRSAYIDELKKYRLLVIDDLGAERQSDYALEQVYSVIDARCNAKRPLIVTTNLSLGELQKAPNMDYQRIYDRVLAMCVPIKFDGESRRKDIAAEKVRTAKEIFG